VSWPQFNIRDLLLATALLAIGFAWPILLIVIVPVIAAGILARMRSRAPLAHVLYIGAVIYPWMMLSLIYLVWGLAWYRSGSRPIPYETEFGLDSPFVNAVHDVFRVMDVGLPVAFPLGLVALIFTVEPRSPLRKSELIARGIVLLCAWIGVVLWLMIDSSQAIEWYFD
jgi:hypothetical protein